MITPQPLPSDIDSDYLYVLVLVNNLQGHIDWLYLLYQTWTEVHLNVILLMPRGSWAFYRSKINYVDESWTSLRTMVGQHGDPELRELLTPLEERRLIWQVTKMFLQDVLETSEYLDSHGIIDSIDIM